MNCATCGLLIQPGESWDLGHTEDRTGWAGPEHAKCNRSKAGVKGHQVQLRSAKPTDDWKAECLPRHGTLGPRHGGTARPQVTAWSPGQVIAARACVW
jgi:hypothetical protein